MLSSTLFRGQTRRCCCTNSESHVCLGSRGQGIRVRPDAELSPLGWCSIQKHVGARFGNLQNLLQRMRGAVKAKEKKHPTFFVQPKTRSDRRNLFVEFATLRRRRHRAQQDQSQTRGVAALPLDEASLFVLNAPSYFSLIALGFFVYVLHHCRMKPSQTPRRRRQLHSSRSARFHWQHGEEVSSNNTYGTVA